jgi:indoleamine 2,3-dioxygenase
LEPNRPREIGNIALNQTFYAGIDEEWFVLIHVDIEQRAAPALAALSEAQFAKDSRDQVHLLKALSTIGLSLDAVNESMNRMPEFCDPYIYYHRVRPYIHGWRNHPAIPDGVSYEGVEEFEGKPQTFRGETGAQSSIVPALDAVLGIGHAQDVLRDYLMEMRAYMPPNHRAFIEAREAAGSVRDFAIECGGATLEAYDYAVAQVERFRSKHLEYAATYIFKQSQTDGKNPHAVGTGGTPFMPYLKKHRDETTATVVCPVSTAAH